MKNDTPIQSILDSTVVSVFINTLIALFLAILYWEHEERAVLIWFITFIIVLFYRLGVYLLYKKEKIAAKRAYLLSLIGIFASAVMWVLPLWTFLRHADLFFQFFMSLFLVGISTGAMILYALDLLVALGYVSITLLSLLLWYVSFMDRPHFIMAILIGVYYIFLLVNIKKIHRLYTSYLALSGQKQGLMSAFEKSSEKFKALLDHAPFGLFFYDKDFKIQEVNKTMLKSLGVSKEKLLGFDLRKLDNEALKSSLFTPIQKRKKGSYEGPYRSIFSGREFMIDAQTVPIYDKDKEVVGALSIVRNIDEEYRRKKRLEAYANFCFNNPNPVFQIDCRSGEVVMENEKAAILRSLAMDWERVKSKICKIDTIDTFHFKVGSHTYLFTSIPTQDGMRNVYAQEITDEIKAKEEADFYAFYDELTKLPRKKLFLKFLEEANKRGKRFGKHNALLFIDLDDFKNINDTFGHATGDRVLSVLAKRLKGILRSVDTISRFGGDEFVVLLGDLSEDEQKAKEDVEKIAQKILETIKLPITIDNHQFIVTASIGGVVFQNMDEEELLKNIDISMYEAKKAGKNRLALFDEELKSHIYYKNEILQDLHKAILYNQFEIYYQPQIELHTRRYVAAEALIRWNHPKKGVLRPDQFLPLAEESGLIFDLDLWMIEEVARHIQELDVDRVSVNLSIQNILNCDFVAKIAQMSEEKRLNPAKIEIELVESIIIKDYHKIESIISRLKKLGFRFAIDNFGTGYSSLAHIKDLSIDTIKIDRSFVKGLGIDKDDEILTKSIIDIARNFGITTVGEGVEKRVQVEFLEALGCDLAQGYYFCEPLPLKKLQEFLKMQSPKR